MNYQNIIDRIKQTEIKYRAWDMQDEIMYYQHGLIDFRSNGNGLWQFYQLDLGTIMTDNNAGILMRYTGIKSREDNQDVYQGDMVIVRGDQDFTKFDSWIISLQEPEYILLVSPDGSDAIPLMSFNYHGSIHKVIGNVFEGKNEKT